MVCSCVIRTSVLNGQSLNRKGLERHSLCLISLLFGYHRGAYGLRIAKRGSMTQLNREWIPARVAVGKAEGSSVCSLKTRCRYREGCAQVPRVRVQEHPRSPANDKVPLCRESLQTTTHGSGCVRDWTEVSRKDCTSLLPGPRKRRMTWS